MHVVMFSPRYNYRQYLNTRRFQELYSNYKFIFQTLITIENVVEYVHIAMCSLVVN